MPGSVTSDLTRQQQMQGNLAATQDPDVVQNEVVDESKTTEQPVNSEDVPPIWWNENVHTIVRNELANTNIGKTDPRSGDVVSILGRSFKNLEKSVEDNALTAVTAARSDIGALELSINGKNVEVPGMSLRTIRLNQDKYPDFIVLGMPNISTGKFNLHVTDKQTGYALNQEQLIMFINNIVRPALLPQTDGDIIETAS